MFYFTLFSLIALVLSCSPPLPQGGIQISGLRRIGKEQVVVDVVQKEEVNSGEFRQPETIKQCKSLVFTPTDARFEQLDESLASEIVDFEPLNAKTSVQFQLVTVKQGQEFVSIGKVNVRVPYSLLSRETTAATATVTTSSGTDVYVLFVNRIFLYIPATGDASQANLPGKDEINFHSEYVSATYYLTENVLALTRSGSLCGGSSMFSVKWSSRSSSSLGSTVTFNGKWYFQSATSAVAYVSGSTNNIYLYSANTNAQQPFTVDKHLLQQACDAAGPVACTKDAKQCPDGSTVGRVPPKCEFEACPMTACTKDAKQCPDGSTVGRVPPKCEFEACPMTACPRDAKECPDGTTVGRVPPKCEFEACPAVACTKDAKVCPDGTTVSRVPPKCEFEACPAVACTKDAKVCPNGTTVSRVPPACEFAPCKGVVHCTDDAKECPDGSFVGRTGPNCEFAPCKGEPVACTADAKKCPDGSYVGRTAPHCEFAPCPGVSCPDYECPAVECKEGETSVTGKNADGCPTCPKCVTQQCPVYDCQEPVCEEGQKIITPKDARGCATCPACVDVVRGCTEEAKECPDGSFVSRTGPNCEFPECPTTNGCPEDLRECPDGTTVARAGPDCKFPDCDENVACELDARVCPDGTSVGRVPPKCEFQECPKTVVDEDNAGAMTTLSLVVALVALLFVQ